MWLIIFEDIMLRMAGGVITVQKIRD